MDLLGWITAVEIPALAGLFGLIWRIQKDLDDTAQRLRALIEARSAQLHESLSAFRLDVARTYTPAVQVRELEGRLTSHLLRIEAKLDSTALKAEVLHAERKPHNA